MKLWDSLKKMFSTPKRQSGTPADSSGNGGSSSGASSTSGNSRDQARDRLRLVLVHDRATISPVMMDKLKEELMQTLSRYMQVDEVLSITRLEQTEKEIRLVATFPILKINRNYAEHIS
ncbi:MAG: cell division topological specificity factor MinE [Peptococcaceae bacterium]|nr:cell division topological specificity factor MinE [Peptococcaceae bacterium]